MKKLLLTILIAAASMAAPQPSHEAGAKELYQIMSPRDNFISSFVVAMQPQFVKLAGMGFPEAKIDRLKQATQRFAENIADDPELEAKMTAVYVETFTQSEIRELIGFYKTDIGKKTLRTLPDLFAKGAKIGEELALKHQAGYEQEVQSILAQTDSADGQMAKQ